MGAGDGPIVRGEEMRPGNLPPLGIVPKAPPEPKGPPRPGDIRMLIQVAVREVLRDTLFPIIRKQDAIDRKVNGVAFVMSALVEVLVDKGVITREDLNKKVAALSQEAKEKQEKAATTPPSPPPEEKKEEKKDEQPTATPTGS